MKKHYSKGNICVDCDKPITNYATRCYNCAARSKSQFGEQTYKNKEWLLQKYECERLSMPQIAEIVHADRGTISFWLGVHGIRRRTSAEALRLLPRSGSKSPNWKGGRRYTGYGYVRRHYETFTDNELLLLRPMFNKNYILEHRAIVALSLGRPLKRSEMVHHINTIKDDNRLENLKLVIQVNYNGELVCFKCGAILNTK